MIAIIGYFVLKIDKRVDVMYESHIQQPHIDKEQDWRINRLENDMRQPTYLNAKP